MKYISENHSKHLLMCHLIFVCKYRKKLLSKVGHDIKTEIEYVANYYGWQIIEQENRPRPYPCLNSLFSEVEYS